MAELSANQLGLSKADLPNSIIEVIATLGKQGFDAYIVGGGVRDTLLGLHPKDFDAVTDAKPFEVKDVFGKRCRIIGRRFQLAHVYSGRDMIEVATFRAPPDNNAHTTSDGMIVRDNVWGDIKQDFARRDFSINALYYHPLKGVVHDFCDAMSDIESKTLRLLGHAPVRIEEDPVRLLRALRFKAKLGFEFDTELSEQFNDKNWALLEQVSPHRLYDESQKMFTGGYLVPLLPLLFEYDAIKHLIVYPPKAPTRLVNQVAINTDKRIDAGKSINPAFFYAALLWDNYLYQLDKNKQRGMNFADAQVKAAIKVVERQRVKTAIPRFAEQFIRDIWLLQPRLASPRAKQISNLAEHPRFRAAFDFLLLREQCDDKLNPLSESTNGMGQWWQTYQTLTHKEQQQAIADYGSQARRGGRKRQQRSDVKDYMNEEHTQTATQTTPTQNTQAAQQKAAPVAMLSKPSQQALQERAQLEKLSLDAISGKNTKKRSKPKPLFRLSADKLAGFLPKTNATQPTQKLTPHDDQSDSHGNRHDNHKSNNRAKNQADSQSQADSQTDVQNSHRSSSRANDQQHSDQTVDPFLQKLLTMADIPAKRQRIEPKHDKSKLDNSNLDETKPNEKTKPDETKPDEFEQDNSKHKPKHPKPKQLKQEESKQTKSNQDTDIDPWLLQLLEQGERVPYERHRRVVNG